MLKQNITNLFIAPEILDYNPITTAADIWSLGAVLYVMLTGCSPFAGDTIQETYLNVAQGKFKSNHMFLNHMVTLVENRNISSKHI